MTDWFTHRAILAGIILVVACAYVSFGELKYIVRGRTVDAALMSAKEEYAVKHEGGMPYPRLRVVYEFDDGAQVRSETDFVPTDWPVAKGAQTIPVEFIPGTDSSRLKGNDHKAWLWASGVVLILSTLIGGLWWKYRDVQ